MFREVHTVQGGRCTLCRGEVHSVHLYNYIHITILDRLNLSVYQRDGQTDYKYNLIYFYKYILIYCYIDDILTLVLKGGVMMDKDLSSLVIRLDKDLHRQIKATCAIKGISIRDYIIELINQDIQKQKSKVGD